MLTPYPKQQENVDRLVERFRQGSLIGLDVSKTGTGKTIVALEVLRALGWKALVICPKGARTNWRRMAEEQGVSDSILEVVNPERVRCKNTKWWNGKQWNMPANTMIIWDEVHKHCSGVNTQTGKVLVMTKAWKVPVLALSATVADSPLKMRAIGYLLGLHKYYKSSFYDWCRRNGCYSSPWHSGMDFPKGKAGLTHMQAVHDQIKDSTVCLTTNDIPEFPEGILEVNLYDLENSDIDEATKIWKDMDLKLKSNEDIPLVEQLRVRQRLEQFKVPIMEELTADLLQEGNSVVVFVCFRDTLHKLKDQLQLYSWMGPVSVIHGDQSDKERNANIDAFQANTAHVCIAMIQAGGVSINLHDVKKERPRVSLISPSWSAVEVVQALGRILRAEGTKALQIFVLLAGTVEETVYRAIKRKLSNISALNVGLNDDDLSYV